MEKVEKKEKGQLLKVQEGSKTKDEMPKKTNKTWEAFGKSKGCFIINDPKFLL